MTFVCVLRLVSSWFPARRIPLVTQLTGTLGQLGAVVAAIPMTWALGHLGWTPAYLGAAGVGVLLIVALLFLLGDAPGQRHLRGPRLSLSTVRQQPRRTRGRTPAPASASGCTSPRSSAPPR